MKVEAFGKVEWKITSGGEGEIVIKSQRSQSPAIVLELSSLTLIEIFDGSSTNYKCTNFEIVTSDPSNQTNFEEVRANTDKFEVYIRGEESPFKELTGCRPNRMARGDRSFEILEVKRNQTYYI